MEVGNLDRVRVSDRKSGKIIRIRLSSTRKDLDLYQTAVTCSERLNSGNRSWKTSGPGPESFTEVSRAVCADCAPGEMAIEIEIKLVIIYRTVKFHCLIPTLPSFAPDQILADSMPFVTYNSGSEEAKKKQKVGEAPTPLPGSSEADEDWSTLTSNLSVEGLARARHCTFQPFKLSDRSILISFYSFAIL